MNKFERNHGMPIGVHIKAKDSDPVVLNGLALTPRRIDELAKQGIPISESVAGDSGMFFDGYSDKNLSFEPPRQYQRHYDIIEAYNTQIESRSKFNKYLDSVETDNGVVNVSNN